jgi:hypothetical protein
VALLIEKTAFCGGGLVIVLLGIPVYFIWRSFSNKKLSNGIN